MFDYNKFKEEVDMEFVSEVQIGSALHGFIDKALVLKLLHKRDKKLKDAKVKMSDQIMQAHSQILANEDNEINNAIETLKSIKVKEKSS